MFKVAYICSTLIRRGPVNVLYNLLSELLKTDFHNQFEPVIITLSVEENDSRISDFEKLGIKIVCLSLPRGLSSIFSFKALQRAVAKESPNICHSFGFRSDIFNSLLSSSSSCKRVSSIFNYPYDDFTMSHGRVMGSIMAKYNIHCFSKLDYTTVCSNFILDKLEGYSKFPKELIYTGVDVEFFKPFSTDERMTMRKDMGIAPDAIVYIFIANMIPRKNPELLVKAYAEYSKKTSKKVHLLMMGDGVLLNQCKFILNDSTITYLGYQDETLKFLRISDFYVSPSFSEGFPTAVLEALSVGLPCILSDIKPHREMLHGLKRQMLFAAADVSGLINCFEESLCVELSVEKEMCMQYLRSNFSSYLMLQKHLSFYKRLLN